MDLRPTPQQERWRVAAARVGLDRASPWLAERAGGWKTVGLLTRCALFALGAVAAGLTVAITTLLHVPGPLVVAGLVAVGVAEWLVASGRFYGAGVEEALGVAGLLLVVAEYADVAGSGHAMRTALLVALAFAIAGARFLNPLFTTLAVAALSFAVDAGASAAGQGAGHGAVSGATLAGLCCFLSAALALALGSVPYRRPSVDRMLDWLVALMPLGGYLWLEVRGSQGITREFLRHPSLVGLLPLVLTASLGAVALAAGIRRRRHAPLIAFMGCVACLAYEVRNLSGLALEVRLILWGVVALAVALALDRALRTPRQGITSRSVGRDPQGLALLQLAGAGALTPPAPPSAAAPGAAFRGGGGQFDGGGASGGY